jgi:hypothetical protein
MVVEVERGELNLKNNIFYVQASNYESWGIDIEEISQEDAREIESNNLFQGGITTTGHLISNIQPDFLCNGGLCYEH